MTNNFEHVTNTPTLRKELESRYGQAIKLVGQFRDPKKLAEFRCENEHTFRALAKDVLSKGVCPRCPKKKTESQYKADLKRNWGDDLILVDPYLNTDTKARHKCMKCDHEWMIRPKDALGLRCFCPNCKNGKNILTESEDEIELLEKFRKLSAVEQKKHLNLFG